MQRGDQGVRLAPSMEGQGQRPQLALPPQSNRRGLRHGLRQGQGHQGGGPRGPESAPPPTHITSQACGSAPGQLAGTLTPQESPKPLPGQATELRWPWLGEGRAGRRALLPPPHCSPETWGRGCGSPTALSNAPLSPLPIASCLVHGGPRLTSSPAPCGRAWHPALSSCKGRPLFSRNFGIGAVFPVYFQTKNVSSHCLK